MADKGILLSGLPESGKTTFLAALWYFVFNSPAEQEYASDSLENTELEYLNSIARKWAGCNDVGRTNQTKMDEVLIHLKHKHTAESITLRMPDINGETFRRQFEDREWDEEFDNILDNIYGLLLFIDPRDNRNKPKLIFQENQYYRIFGTEIVNTTPEQPWTADLAPSQVKIVDFLQMLDVHKPGVVKKISIIVSCWDLVKNEESPELFCKKEVPLLYQYVKANEGLFKVKYFGVSAQGGSYEKEANEKEELLAKEPLERIIITDGLQISNNILSPIFWITNEYKD